MLLCCTEDYYRIGEKTLNTFLLGASMRAAFTMKTDDDSFVHLSRLLALLLAVPAGTTAYIGNMDCESSRWIAPILVSIFTKVSYF